jgi:hypothetical protein
MTRHVIALHGKADRERAARIIDAAPAGWTVEVRAPARTLDQNALMWVYLSKISMAKPGGRIATPDVWKAIFLHACGHAVQFEAGLDGSPFPIGFRSSKLTKAQMADLITFIQAWAAENRVPLGDEEEAA